MKKQLRHFNYRIALIFLAALVMGCGDDNNCVLNVEGEEFTLSQNAKSFVSNYVDAENIIFKDEQGNEVSFMISDYIDTLVSYEFLMNCVEDSTQLQSVKGQSQVIQAILSNSGELENPIFVSLIQIPKPDISKINQSVVVTLGDFFTNTSREEGHYLFEHNIDSSSPFTTFADSLDINGQRYYSVYEESDLSPTPKLDIKYTEKEGIIFIGNVNNGKEYSYVRKE